MSQPSASTQPGLDAFVRGVIQQYRTKLLDLTSRNPLISFKHSDRARSHIRVIEEIPEKIFTKLAAGKELFFEPLPDPELVPPEEHASIFMNQLRRAKDEDEVYKQALSELGPNPSTRQKQRIERELRNRVRLQLGLTPFQPTWDPAKRITELGLNPGYDLPLPTTPATRRYEDMNIQTPFFADDLERKLGGLRESARVLEKDAGFNALFCTFGYLEYYESDQSEEKRLAPLVFVPIVLDRILSSQRYAYFIKNRNEDIETNVALAELLKNMAIAVPTWNEDERQENPLGTYLGRVENAIVGKRDWKVHRYVTIGLFTFSTLAMYKDLDPERWPPEASLEQRPVLRTLIAGAETSEAKYADDYEIDSLRGPEPLLITDADSSQHSAVVDALRSKTSQVIQGPPGTGKSQTITNIIAAALNEGLTVLFVAEKMAALEVVKKRLDAAGLEVFCFELHSSKTSKTMVADSLAQRIEYGPPRLRPEVAQSNADALSAAKTDLLYYVQRVNEHAGNTGLKIYDVLLGSAIREAVRRDLPATIADARFGNPLQVSPHAYRQMLDAAATLESQLQPTAAFGPLAKHPWRGVRNIEITELDENRLTTLMSAWNAAIRALLDAANRISESTGMSLPSTQIALKKLCHEMTQTVAPPSALLTKTYSGCSTESNRAHLKQVLHEFHSLAEFEAKSAAFIENPMRSVQDLGSESLGRALAVWSEFAERQLTAGALIDLECEEQKTTALLAQTEAFCTAFTQAAGLQDSRITSLQAAVAGLELVERLPRPLWNKRSPAILDDANQATLDRACTRMLKLNQSRIELEAKFDLNLLPSHQELRNYGIALRSSNAFTALFNSTCRQARRVFRSISRNRSKAGRSESADGLLRCAQYIADVEVFTKDSVLKSVCGSHYSGLETPLPEILAVSNWATDVRQRLAPLGEAGLGVRHFLFSATIKQIDNLLAFAHRPAFASMTNVLRELSEDGDKLWTDIVRQQRVRSDCLALAADIIQRGAFRKDCARADIANARDAIKGAEVCIRHIEENASGLALVGGSLSDLRRDAERLAVTLNFAESVASLPLPSEFTQYFFDDPQHIPEINTAACGVLGLCSALSLRTEEVNKLADIDPAVWCGATTFEQSPLQTILLRNHQALENVSALRDYLDFLLAEDAAVDQGIGPVLSAYSTAGADYRNLRRAVEFAFFRSAAESILNDDPRLRRHSGATHDELRSQFQALDREYLELRRKHLAITLAGRPCPPGNSFGPVAELTELALITRVAGQSRPRLAVRELIHRSGRALQAIKPCWMSPISVAQYLEPGKLHFDLVIMDEASQIRPEEALGAIARAGKAVIVGDQMQLPPTPFFQKLSAGNISDDEDCEETKEDSVLEAASGRFYPSRRLKWHYRSEHASLIAFSNHEFYNDQLTVFPSPFYDHPEYGVSLLQTGGIYDSGFNKIEGEAVVKAAVEFMKNYPDQSLGIVAVNAKQKDFIREQLDRAAAINENAAAYIQKWDPTLESVFVKNLENVQGDERDVIYISTVYGKDPKGNFHQRFGPINGIYGHRRLNVLFTRAKKKVTVFTSMVPEEIEDEDKNWGVKVLKGYLKFARDGFAPTATIGADCDSEFEEWVLDVLRSHGYQAVPQLGVCGYRIDIAVRNPVKPGVFLCGIECDGAMYHNARSVRERDRLRQEILERYGWKLYRIWSTDWFRNPNLQTRKLLAYLQNLQPPVATV